MQTPLSGRDTLHLITVQQSGQEPIALYNLGSGGSKEPEVGAFVRETLEKVFTVGQ